MKKDHPHVIVLAGPNGAGKTTASRELLQGEFGLTEFVNADVIATGLSGFDPDRVAFEPLADRWRVYNNSGSGRPQIVAMGGLSRKTEIVDFSDWALFKLAGEQR